MVQAVINFGGREEMILNVIKGKFGFRNKSEAVNYALDRFEEELLEPELRPEYIQKLQRLEKEKGIPFKNIAELRKIIEG